MGASESSAPQAIKVLRSKEGNTLSIKSIHFHSLAITLYKYKKMPKVPFIVQNMMKKFKIKCFVTQQKSKFASCLEQTVK